MRIAIALVLAGCLGVLGCARPKPAAVPGNFSALSAESPASVGSSPTASNAPPRLIVTPETGLSAKVALANASARYVVLTFSSGRLPSNGQVMSIYRRGLKVGEVTVTSLRRDETVVADITTGEAQAGDEAREQ
jgi:hypothetical protein